MIGPLGANTPHKNSLTLASCTQLSAVQSPPGPMIVELICKGRSLEMLSCPAAPVSFQDPLRVQPFLSKVFEAAVDKWCGEAAVDKWCGKPKKIQQTWVFC